jgi:hypothetical protein
MGVTRFSVYAGLAGLSIVRDDQERELELPIGPPYEEPLLIQDRNFNVGEDGRPIGALLPQDRPGSPRVFRADAALRDDAWRAHAVHGQLRRQTVAASRTIGRWRT